MRIFEITEAIEGTGTLGKNIDSRINKVAMKYVNKLMDMMEETGHPIGSHRWQIAYPLEWWRINDNRKHLIKLVDDAMKDFANEYTSIGLDYIKSQSLKTLLGVELKNKSINDPYNGFFHPAMYDNEDEDEWDEYGDSIPGIVINVKKEKLWNDFRRGTVYMSDDVHRSKIHFSYIREMNRVFLHEMIHLVQHVRSKQVNYKNKKTKTYIPDYRKSKNRKRKGGRGYSSKKYKDSIEYLAYFASEREVEAWAAHAAYDMVYGIGKDPNAETIRAAIQSVKTGDFKEPNYYNKIRTVVNSALRSPNPTPKEKQYIKFWKRVRKKIIQHLLTYLEQEND